MAVLYFVYIMASESKVLYIGMTNNLNRRVYEHKEGLIEGFTKRYKCNRLVYYESSSDVRAVIEREKQLKKWSRIKKVNLIKNMNAEWDDLSTTLEMTD